MTSALDLLMDSDSTAETTTLLESNGICTIDSRTRTIFVPPEIVVGAVQSDKNAERIKFSCPKIVGDNLDLSKFSIRINFENVSSVDPDISIKDQYICEDASINEDNITFSWVIGKNAARYMGTIRFIVCAVKTDSDSNISIEWNTTVAQIPVLEGIEVDQPSLDENNKDLINQLLAITKTASDEAVKNVNSAKEQAITDIQNVSQPDKTLTVEGGIADAKATGNAISSLREDISTKITKFYASSQGKNHLADSDNGKIQDMMLYGKSSQDGTPTPENPVEIKSVVNPTMKVCGKNLLNATLQTTTVNGVTCTANGDGTYTLNGTTTTITTFDIAQDVSCSSFRLVGCPVGGAHDASYELQARTNNLIYGYDTGDGKNIKADKNFFIRIRINTGINCNNLLFKPMIVDASLYPDATYDDFEPYHKQTVTLPYTLNAIPVESGGNVTIDGQQYIADYVDVERGKLIRMVDSSKLDNTQSIVNKTEWLLAESQEIDLTTEEITAFKALSTYYPTTNISVNSEQLDGYTVFNYPISMENGWNYVKQQIGDTREYIYDMDARTQDTDLQAAEAYVNSEYAVALTELEV